MEERIWKGISDCILEAGAAASRVEILRKFMEGASALIQADVGIGVFDRSLRCILCDGWAANTLETYNDYYRLEVPFILYDEQKKAVRGCDLVRWNEYTHTEFMSDFGIPMGLSKGLSPFRPYISLNMSLQRSKRCPEFTNIDSYTLDLLNTHLNNLLTASEKLAQAENRSLGTLQVLDLLPKLSKREAEILSLCSKPLSIAEIASLLFISRRTVETHMAHIFDKLGVRSRREALQVLKSRNA